MAKPESSTSHPHWPPHSATCLPTSPLKPRQTLAIFRQPNLFALSSFQSQPLMMSDRSKPTIQMLYEAAPSSRQTVKFLTAATIAGTFLLLSGLTLTGTVIALVLATPVLVLFSPILIPAGITLLLTAAGFLFSGGCGVAAVSTLVWIYNYVKGKHPIGADQLDYARDKIVDKARDVKEKTKEYGQFVQQKAQAATA